MKKSIKFILVMFSAVILFSACSQEDNPVVPDPGNGDPDPIVINTPTHLKITKIAISTFPPFKPNGDSWDYNILPGADATRPDIYVKLHQFASNDIIYRSNTVNNASTTSTYEFTEPHSSNSGSLPYNLAYGSHYTIELMDNDGVSADDFMADMDVEPQLIYPKDNSTTFFRSAYDVETLTTFKIWGEWVY